MDDVKLLPCPRCGWHSPVLDRGIDGHPVPDGPHVGCPGMIDTHTPCGMSAPNPTIWNTRAPASDGRAEALLAEAVEALRPFAEAVKGNYFYQSDDLLISSGHGKDDLRWVIPLGDWRLARALIARIKEDKDNG